VGPARGDQPAGRRDRLGQVGEEDRRDHGHADAAALEQPEPDDDRLGDAVQNDAEHDRQCRARCLLTPRALAPIAAKPVDQEIAGEKGACAREQAERDTAASRGRVERLAYEFIGDGADEDAGAESHDQAQRCLRDPEAERGQASDDERRPGDQPPEEGAGHQPCCPGPAVRATAA
jgi:hypothetical protein